MKKLTLSIMACLICSCAVFKIEPEGDLAIFSGSAEAITIKKENQWTEGIHCFEPLFYVLTLGLIPTHCVDTYSVSTETESLGSVKVTSMQGWITLLMAPFPSWQFGYGSEPQTEIKNMVMKSN